MPSRTEQGRGLVRRTSRALVAGGVVAAVLVPSGCSVPSPTSPVVTLAKAEGWRTGLADDSTFAILEIAYDLETAHRLWDENAGAALAAPTDVPVSAGRYGTLDDVDLGSQVLAVFSSGQSGLCDEWVSDVSRDGPEVDVTTTTGLADPSCDAVYVPYRVVIAVDRTAVPREAELGAARATLGSHGGLPAEISTYPRR